MIIADENPEQYWIELLRSKGCKGFSVREIQPGISDNAVIELVRDKSVILLRYDRPLYHTIESSLLNAVNLYHDTDLPVFITVTKNKTRVRKL